MVFFLKGIGRRLRPKAHMILDDPFPWSSHNDGLKIVFGQPYGPKEGPLWLF